MEKKDIASYTLQELEDEMKAIGEKPFRAKQIYEWIHVKLVESFDEMTNVSKALREKLDREYEIATVSLVERQISGIDGTNKFLFELSDGNMIESVLMKYKHGNSICISSQVGCRMGCRFCASTIGGLVRNLTPLDNYENFVRFIRMVSDGHGLHISQRNITASTCGIVPNIRRLADEKFQITLALSLHGSNQEKRKSLMPVANKYELSEVLEACDEYFEKTGRRITFEYSLVHGVNDTEEDIRELTALLKHKNCHLNLIPVNPVRENNFKRPDKKTAGIFQNKLEKNGINVTIRREMGSDIDGACGQLRIKHRDNNKENENENIFND